MIPVQRSDALDHIFDGWVPESEDSEPLPDHNGSGPWLPPAGASGPANELGLRVSGPPIDAGLRAQAYIAAALRIVYPESVWDDSVQETARRVFSYWAEYVPQAEPDFKFTTFEAAPSQMVVVSDIEFSSLCAHHLLPFTGRIHIGYIPGDTQAGLSKIPRLVQFWARRPQVQEQLTSQILHDLRTRLRTKDVMVVCEARHTCVSARGTRLHNGVMRTSLPSGLFLSSPPARSEFLALLARDGV